MCACRAAALARMQSTISKDSKLRSLALLSRSTFEILSAAADEVYT